MKKIKFVASAVFAGMTLFLVMVFMIASTEDCEWRIEYADGNDPRSEACFEVEE